MWSRFLYGGKPILIAAVLATALALMLGTTVGLIAAYNRGKLDDLLMRTMDVVLALPQIILALVVISMFGAIDHADRAHRRVLHHARASPAWYVGAAISVVERDFVAAAESLGESRTSHPELASCCPTFPGRCSSRPTCA